MASAEAGLPESERIRVVSIVTPNHLHHPVAKAFLEQGIHVVCDKPLTTTLEDAEELCRLAGDRDLVLRGDAQLHRLSDGQRGPRAGPLGGAR